MGVWYSSTITVIITVAFCLNICILIAMYTKDWDLIGTLNYTAVKQSMVFNKSSADWQKKETRSIWTSFINDLFPELENVTSEDLQPLHLSPTSSRRRKLVIGIPLVTERAEYINDTLSSLFDKMDEDYRNDVLVILMIASNETDANNFYKDKVTRISENFSDEIRSGLLQVIAVPKAWYRIDVRSISPTFNDSPERMYWRTKQNIDYIYIMMHASQICDYYLQLEDDVEAADGYMRVIFNYLTFKSDSPWFIISFTSMGFIGRLFRSSDLKYMSYAIALYHHFKPVDWILYDLLTSRYCDPGKTHQECLANRRQYEISSGASQFQHIGKISSLEGKTQTIHDSRFGKGATQGKRGNPPANVTSSVRTKKFHEPQFGYDNYFAMWLLNVTSGDYVSMVFHEEILLTGVMFMSGLPPVPQYKLGPEALVYAFNNADERVHLGQFSSKGDFLLRLKGLLVTELRIEFTAPLQNEVVIDHILIDKQENS